MSGHIINKEIKFCQEEAKTAECRSLQRFIWSKEDSFEGRKVGVSMGNQGLDREWLKLVEQAKKAGLTKEEVRQFLLKKKNGRDLQPEVLEKVK